MLYAALDRFSLYWLPLPIAQLAYLLFCSIVRILLKNPAPRSRPWQ